MLVKELTKPTMTKIKRKHGHTTMAILNAGFGVKPELCIRILII
jgi:hypothetical protein